MVEYARLWRIVNPLVEYSNVALEALDQSSSVYQRPVLKWSGIRKHFLGAATSHTKAVEPEP